MSFRAISCLACQTVLMPRSRLVDFNKFYYNLKVTRGGHEFRHESTGTRAQGTKAQVLDMLTQFQGQTSPLFVTEPYFTEIYKITISICQCSAFLLKKLACMYAFLSLSPTEAILNQI